jgi:hypothetical protein
MKTYFLTILFILIGMSALAQNASIKGKIMDNSDSSAIAGATVILLRQKDSSLVDKTVSTKKGKYRFENLQTENLILVISTTNYKAYTLLFNLKDEEKEMPIIKLEPKGKDLDVVTITAKTAAVSMKEDTAQFSASQYKVDPDATIEDLIKKMPSISVARDGTITAQGETVKKVTIDGKDFFGDDAAAALKNLPADVVDKIQVFDRLSDQARLTGFDDGNSTKAINVVTKSGIKNGQLGRLFAGYGNDDRYNVGGNSSFFKDTRRLSLVGSFNSINQQNFAGQDLLGISSGNNNKSGGGQPGTGKFGGNGGNSGNDFTVGQVSGISKTSAFGVNYSNEYNKKLIVSGSYFYNNSINENQSITNTENFYKLDTNLFSKQNSTVSTNNNNHRINARIEYNIDSFNTISYIPSISFQQTDAASTNNFNSYYGAAGIGTLYDITNVNSIKSNNNKNGYNIKNNILYRHLFSKKGRSIALGINHTLAKNDGESITDGSLKFYKKNILTKDSIQNQFYDNATNGYTIAGTIAYTEPLSKKAQLQFDYNPSFQNNKANQQTFLDDAGKYSKLDTLLTNKFDNTIFTNNVGVTYRITPAKEELFQIGISYQTSTLGSDRIFPRATKVDQSFSNFLPNIIFRKKFSKKSNIRVFYRANVNFPSINQLQDVVNLSSPFRASTGNADLKQSYTHYVGSRFTHTDSKTNKSFFAGLFLQTASNYITNTSFIPSADSVIQQGITLKEGSLLTKPLNLDGYRNVRLFANYSFPLKLIKSNFNLTGNFNFSRLPGLINNRPIITDNFLYSMGVILNSNISEYVDYNFSYTANFNQTQSSATGNKNFVNQNVGLQFNLLNKKGWFIQNDFVYQINSGLSAGLNQQFNLWNAGIGKKFLPKNAGEIKLSVFDLLKQNQSVTRFVDETKIQDAQNLVLKQYFMLTFTYSLKNFGNPVVEEKKKKKKKK